MSEEKGYSKNIRGKLLANADFNPRENYAEISSFEAFRDALGNGQEAVFVLWDREMEHNYAEFVIGQESDGRLQVLCNPSAFVDKFKEKAISVEFMQAFVTDPSDMTLSRLWKVFHEINKGRFTVTQERKGKDFITIKLLTETHEFDPDMRKHLRPTLDYVWSEKDISLLREKLRGVYGTSYSIQTFVYLALPKEMTKTPVNFYEFFKLRDIQEKFCDILLYHSDEKESMETFRDSYLPRFKDFMFTCPVYAEFKDGEIILEKTERDFPF